MRPWSVRLIPSAWTPSARALSAWTQARPSGSLPSAALRPRRSWLGAGAIWGLLWGLSACAPAYSPPTGEAAFRAAFSRDGVAWVNGGRACVARAPGFRVVCPALPPVRDVAWNGGDAWAAVPGVGAVVTLDQAARSLNAGKVVALSAARIYREDGSALTYDGLSAPGVPGAPTAAITGGDSLDYVLLAGQLRRVSDGVALDSTSTFLSATPTGAVSVAVPTLWTLTSTYRLQGGHLQRLDAAGQTRASVPHPSGRIGLVGSEVVTVDSGGTVRRFTETLEPVRQEPGR